MTRRTWGPLALGLLLAGTSSAAPVLRPALLTLGVSIHGLAPVTLSMAADITLDSAAGRITLPAGVISLATPLVVPVTASTSVASLTVETLSNLSGVFSTGGAAIGGTETPCPVSLAGRQGVACVPQTGFGGVMGLTGTIAVHVIPGIVVVPVNLNAALLGQGGYTTQPMTVDAAPWTIGTGQLVIGGGTPDTLSVAGSNDTGRSSFTLVTPTFVVALGTQLPMFGSLHVQFVDGGVPTIPEPGTLLLLVPAMAALAIRHRRPSR